MQAASSKVEPSTLYSNNAGEVIKKEPEDVPVEVRTEDEEGRRGSWFTEVDFLKPEMRPPLELFDSGSEEDVGGTEVRTNGKIFMQLLNI